MSYGTVEEVQARMLRTMGSEEAAMCEALLEDAAVIVDSYAPDAATDKKRLVSCRMVLRALGDGGSGIPMGAAQGTVAALGYSQSWTMGSGTTGELYLSKIEKKLLGVASRIGSRSPVEPPEREALP